jgi:hypothetical protein
VPRMPGGRACPPAPRGPVQDPPVTKVSVTFVTGACG